MRGRRGRVALAIGVLAAWLPASAMGVSREPGLRTDISIAALSEELERAIPQLMAEARVPGLAVAVVRGGEIAWTRGFGFADRFTPVPVRADTIFQVASNGKAVAGYAATRLVEQGALELDRALHDYLEVPFLPEGPHRSGITLRRVLSHSAGLSNRVDGEGDRRSRFPPGERFAYAGVGFSYLTAVIDAIDPRGFEGTLQAEVLGPLHMESSTYALGASSTYALADPLRDRLAAGHVPAWMPPALFGALFAAASAVVWLVGWTVLRFGLRGRVTVRGAALLLALSVALAVVAGSTLGGIPAALFCASVFVVPAAVVTGLWRATEGRPLLRTAAVGTALLALAGVARSPMPLPRIPMTTVSAAFSLHASAPDLARFLIEVMNPTLLSAESARLYRTAQIRAGIDTSWGLGIGIAHTSEGDAIFHWGQNVGYESLMVAYPEAGIGVVVLTNAAGGLAIVPDVAQLALGGPRFDYFEDLEMAW